MSFFIQTPRLELKRLHLSDAENMYAYASNPEVSRYLTWKRHETPEDSMAVIPVLLDAIEQGKNDGFAIHLKGLGMIGTIGMIWKAENRGEIGYVLHDAHWGRGIVTEAGKAFISYLFERYDNLETIEARCFAGHEASAGVMKKLGMQFQGFLPDEVFVNIDPEKKWPVWHYTLSRKST
ncbi:MAG: GNAT family N-acetyltransferase [Bacteroidia bacterium]